MALFSIHGEPVSRAKGHSVIAAAAYRRGIELHDERLNKVQDYSEKSGLIYSELSIPEDSPEWLIELAHLEKTNPALAIERLWNQVDAIEKRADAQLARNIYFALPLELTAEQNMALVRGYVKSQFTNLGMVADWSIHFDHGNPHVHLLLTFRELTPEGFGKKVRAWNDKALYRSWCEQVAVQTNEQLARHGHDVSIDHRSYEERGIDLIPTKHLGKSISAQEKRGIQTERLQEQRLIQTENLRRIQENPDRLIQLVTQASATFSMNQLATTLSRYINPHDGVNNLVPAELVTANACHADVFVTHAYQEKNVGTQTVSPAFRPSVYPDFPEKTKVLHPLTESAILNDTNRSSPFEAVIASNVLNDIHEPTPDIKPLAPALFDKLLATIEKHDSAFSDEQVAKVLFQLSPHMNASLFTQTLTQVKAHLRDSTQVLRLGIGDNGRETFTTQKLFEVENKVQTLTEKLLNARKPILNQATIKKALERHAKETGKTVTDEQYQALMRLIQPSQLSCLVGRAGTGKSFTMGALRTIYESAGFDVQGVALSGVATDGLSIDAGIKSRTIASFAFAYQNQTLKLSEKSLVVMDEAGMTDSHSMLTVLTAVHEAGAKLILLGDPDQLQPVGPGACFRAILERVGKRGRATLEAVYRQVDAWQKQASLDFANGAVDKAMQSYDEKGCIHIEPTENDAMNRLVSDWKHHWLAHQNLSEQIVMTLKNADVAMLNERLRQVLVDEGYLSEGYSVTTVIESDTGTKTARTKKIARGDRLVFLKNDARLGVKNGRFATVTHVHFFESGQVKHFTVRLDGLGKTITIDPTQYNTFDHGYAVTIHKSQGITRDHGFIYVANHSWDRAMAYVAMTRHRLSAHLYTSQTLFPNLSALVKTLNQLPIKDSILHYPLAFARRRGIEPKASHVKSHLVSRLRDIKTKITHDIKRFTHPLGYASDLMAKRQAQDREVARQRAIIVAQYKDLSRKAGKLWGKMVEPLIARGFKPHTPEYQEALVLLPEYAERQALIIQRDALASTLYANASLYTLAMNLNRVDAERLKKEALTHERREKINAYQSHVEQNTLLAQKIAHHLHQEIKAYYPLLKTMNVDVKRLSHMAKLYQARLARLALTPAERIAFDRVAAYQACLTQSAPLLSKLSALYHAEKHPEACLVLQEKLIALGKQKSTIAATILSDRETHAKGLDYFEIGQGIDRKRAQKRWFHLQQAASYHALSPAIVPAKSKAIASTPPTLPLKSIPTHLDLKRLKADLNEQVETIVAHYLGEPKKRRNHQWQYGLKKGSLFVTTQGIKQGAWYDFQTGMGGDMLSLIQQETGGDFKTALKEALHFLGGQSRYQHQETLKQINQREQRQAEALRMAQSEQAKKLAHVQAMALDTVPITGTLAERYLTEHRGITQPLHSDNLRFHPNLKNWSNGQTYPALIVLAHDADGQLSGLQATFLDPTTANKAHLTEGNNKLSRGIIAQGSVVHQAITNNKQPTIALAEGLETALSVACAHPDWEVRLTFGVSNFERATLSALEKSRRPVDNRNTINAMNTKDMTPVVNVEEMNSAHPNIILCADNDGIESGTAKAVNKAVAHLSQQGIKVQVVEPTKPNNVEKWDFNDALKIHGVDIVRVGINKNLPASLIGNSTPEYTETTSQQIADISTQETSTHEEKLLAILLMNYIEMEQKQKELVFANYAARESSDRAVALEANTILHQHNDQLKAMANELNQREDVQTLISEARQQRYDTDGPIDFEAMKTDLSSGNVNLKAIHPLLKALRQKVSSMNLSRQKSHGRRR